MVLHTFIDFDDTIFPTTSHLSQHTLPADIIAVDTLVSLFIRTFMHSTLIRVVTHANSSWVQAVLDMMPEFGRMVQWGYVKIYTCGTARKSDVVAGLMRVDGIVDSYATLGDTVDDMEMVREALQKRGVQHGSSVSSFRFPPRPSTHQVQQNWIYMLREFANRTTTRDECGHLLPVGGTPGQGTLDTPP